METDPTFASAMDPVQRELVDDSSSTRLPLAPPDKVEVSDQFWGLDPRNIQIERISGLIFSSVCLVGALIGLLILWINLGFGWIWFLVAGIAFALVGLLFYSSVAWPPVEHRHARWRLDDEGLEIRRGVFWQHQITIPLGRVQHADVSQGPLQRSFGLGTLTVHTAGTQNASVELQGLAHETAIELRDVIVRQRKDQHVV